MANAQAEIEVWHVNESERFGDWSRRQWSVMHDDLLPSPLQVVPERDIITKVTLTPERSLTQTSLEVLAKLGVKLGAHLGREASMPRRTL